MRNSFVSVVTDINILMKGLDNMMITVIFTAVITIFMIILMAVCFFDLGFISKELVLYWIRKSKKADEQLELARKIIDNNK